MLSCFAAWQSIQYRLPNYSNDLHARYDAIRRAVVIIPSQLIVTPVFKLISRQT